MWCGVMWCDVALKKTNRVVWSIVMFFLIKLHGGGLSNCIVLY